MHDTEQPTVRMWLKPVRIVVLAIFSIMAILLVIALLAPEPPVKDDSVVGLIGTTEALVDSTLTGTVPKTAELASPLLDPQAVEAAKTALQAEPKIKDLLFNPNAGVPWQIGVFDDGTLQYGYAQYICLVLSEHKLVDEKTRVRIIDIVKLANNGGDFHAASLGQVHCKSGQHYLP